MQGRKDQSNLCCHAVGNGNDAVMAVQRIRVDFRYAEGYVRVEPKGTAAVDDQGTCLRYLQGIIVARIGVGGKDGDVYLVKGILA